MYRTIYSLDDCLYVKEILFRKEVVSGFIWLPHKKNKIVPFIGLFDKISVLEIYLHGAEEALLFALDKMHTVP